MSIPEQGISSLFYKSDKYQRKTGHWYLINNPLFSPKLMESKKSRYPAPNDVDSLLSIATDAWDSQCTERTR